MQLNINANQPSVTYTPFWKKLITAGRAAEGLREDWQSQLKEVQKEIGFEYIRFHGIYHDDMMIYHEREDGTPYFNWQYYDKLIDFLLSVNIRPFLELGFMPSALASGSQTIFWWKGNVTPPKDYDKWALLVRETVIHSINRYGFKEVLSWYFEVWNEPNLKQHFWSGDQAEYFKLFKITFDAIKSIDTRLKVGGPATSNEMNGEAPWIRDFLTFCDEQNVQADFVSTHPYPNNWPFDGQKSSMGYRDEDSTYNGLCWLKDMVEKSTIENAEIHLTEWNSSPSPVDLIHDTAFMAPFVIQNNIKCIGLADSLGFWAFTDVFEEKATAVTMFHGGFGLINLQGLKKPSYYGYWFLSKLGDEMLASGSNYFVAKKEDRIQILLWNYCHYKQDFANGNRTELTQHERYSVFNEKQISINLNVDGLSGNYNIITYTLDRENGSVFDSWINNGAISSPTKEELEIIKMGMAPHATIKYLDNIYEYVQDIVINPHGVVFIELIKLF